MRTLPRASSRRSPEPVRNRRWPKSWEAGTAERPDYSLARWAPVMNTARMAGSVPRAVARPVLHHGVARAEHLLRPIVQLEDHLTRQDHLEVDRVGSVHPRVVRLQTGQHAR